jgi:hypothetical protein
MSREGLEKVALGLSAVVLISAMWFWALQIGDVIELLNLAYGE